MNIFQPDPKCLQCQFRKKRKKKIGFPALWNFLPAGGEKSYKC